MIRKIRRNEILTKVDGLNAKERKAYLKRVGEWLQLHSDRLLTMAERPMAKSQNIVRLSSRWSAEDCKALHEGVVLLSALTGQTDTWLPSQLYIVAATRAIKKTVEVLKQFTVHSAQFTVGSNVQKVQGSKNTKSNPNNQNTPKPQSSKGSKEKVLPSLQGGAEGRLPVRPKHIDQYVHLLPQATQERASHYRELMQQMDEARENLRLLMNDPKASAQSREQWAKTITRLDKQIGNINRELDREWDKVVAEGRVIVDDLGNARVKSEAVQSNQSNPNTQSNQPDPADKKKAASIRKWLIDKRNAKTEEQQKKWREKYDEMVSLGGKESVTDKVREAAEYYGVELAIRN